MKTNNYFLCFSILIIFIISLIIITLFYKIKYNKKENFSNLNYEILPPNWDINKNANPKTNPSLLKYNHFKDIPNDLITRTPYTINKYGQQNYNAYFYKNDFIYPLY